MDRDCRAPKRCAPWAIVSFGHVLADTRRDEHARTEALKYVLHFVGDLHQPLHAGRPGDRGDHLHLGNFGGQAHQCLAHAPRGAMDENANGFTHASILPTSTGRVIRSRELPPRP